MGNEAAKSQPQLTQEASYYLASFVDMHGVSKAKMVPAGHLDHMKHGSEMFTGAALDGVPQNVNDDEVAAHPDLSRSIPLPWDKSIIWCPSDLHIKDKPFEACSRTILKRVLDEASTFGLSFNLGIEAEFFIFKGTNASFSPFSDRDTLGKAAYDVRLLLDNIEIVKEIVVSMNDLGWGVYSFDHEDANGQVEIDFDYSDALSMCDRYIFLRLMAGEIARKHGAFASFMPKPQPHLTGSGAHFNISATDKSGNNVFLSTSKTGNLSELANYFAGGIIKHAAAITAVIAPTVNSYKRLTKRTSASGFTWAPIVASFGANNRTNMLRTPMACNRIECRAVDSSVNPYLAAALLISAGLDGIKNEISPGQHYTENLYEMTNEQLENHGVKFLPKSLLEAITAFESSDLAKSVFGSLMFNSYCQYKKQEWEEYHQHVSDWETSRYLKMF